MPNCPDFWEALASRMPRQLDYLSLCEWFAWDLPSNYNIGVDVCDRHAADKGKLAIIHDRGDGTAEKWTFWELKRASDRFANALRTGRRARNGGRAALAVASAPHSPHRHVQAGRRRRPLFTLFGRRPCVSGWETAGRR